MNCKPGDLAVYIGSERPELIGMICEVLAIGMISFSSGSAPACQIKFQREQMLRSRNAMSRIGWVRATSLRPIRDPGDDAKDETLQWLPVPTTEGVPA